jgi:hypothetical protein
MVPFSHELKKVKCNNFQVNMLFLYICGVIHLRVIHLQCYTYAWLLGTKALLLNNGGITARVEGERHLCPMASSRVLSSLPSR